MVMASNIAGRAAVSATAIWRRSWTTGNTTERGVCGSKNIGSAAAANLGYEHVRFFGGKTCEYDGSFRERICELKRPGCAVEYFVYG